MNPLHIILCIYGVITTALALVIPDVSSGGFAGVSVGKSLFPNNNPYDPPRREDSP
ncbi:hypothetical protein O5D80_002441 [Batrachochytrium dendrobatidis]|nr:hypothetical protein O5D80_002441 [Batrachochytrium dendrobatidis]